MPGQPTVRTPTVQVSVLGPFEVRVDGRLVGPSGARRRGLLALLALESARVVPVGTLVDRLWGNDPPASATNVVQTYVSAWRRFLGGREGLLRTVGAGYRLDLTETQCDLTRFRALTRAAREAAGPDGERRAERTLDEALALWRGPVLADLSGEALHSRVTEAVQAEHARALEAWAEAALRTGREPALVLDRLAPLRRAEPLRETAAALVMWAEAAAGRQSDALQTYEVVRRELRDELGADPSALLLEMHARILRADPGLAPGRGTAPAVAPAPTPTSTVALGDPLFGRDQDLTRVAGLLVERRLVTLTGPGGAGKTRLATELLQRHFENGGAGWFADLAPVREDALVVAAVAEAVGAQATAGTDPLAALTARLAAAEGVLVLDNLEHLPRARELVRELRAACPRVLVLATSRQGLGIAGEQQYPVPLLAVPDEATGRSAEPHTLEGYDAVRLLVDRAVAADPSFALTGENAAAIAALVRHLDGLPLAIEIVAPWLRLLPPDALVERLSHAGLDLAARRTDLPERQRSLRSTIEWSYQLLPPAERAVFRRLAVFVSSFSLTAAEEVCAGEDVSGGAVAESLLTLVDSHLVRPGTIVDGQRRFRLLETVREFAAEQLADDPNAERVRNRFVAVTSAWAAELAAHSEGPTSGGWLAAAVAEADNLRSCLRRLEELADHEGFLQLAVDAMVLWFEAGHEDEGERTLRRALAAAPRSARARPIGLTYWSWLRATHDRRAAAEAAQEALDLARQARDPLVEAFAQQTLGDTLTDRAAAEAASRAVFEAAERSEGLPVRYGPTAPGAVRCGASASIAASCADRSLADALTWQRDALRLAELEGDRRITAVNAARLAHLLLSGGEIEAAHELVLRARTLVSTHVTARWEDIVAFSEAELAFHEGRPDDAEQQLMTLVDRAAAGGRPLHARLGSILLVDLLTEAGRYQEAEAVLGRLARIPGALDELEPLAAVDLRRARLARLVGRRDAARATLETVAAALPDDRVPPELVLLHVERVLLAETANERRAHLRDLTRMQAATGIRLPPWEHARLAAVR